MIKNRHCLLLQIHVRYVTNENVTGEIFKMPQFTFLFFYLQENLNQSDMNLKDKNKLYNELESTKHELVTVKVMLEQKDETLKTSTSEIQHLERIAAENQVSVISRFSVCLCSLILFSFIQITTGSFSLIFMCINFHEFDENHSFKDA